MPLPGWKRKELADGTLGALFNFVNGELIPHLKGLRERPNSTSRQKAISEIFSGIERTRIDTERNLLDVLDKVHEITVVRVIDPKVGETDREPQCQKQRGHAHAGGIARLDRGQRAQSG